MARLRSWRGSRATVLALGLFALAVAPGPAARAAPGPGVVEPIFDAARGLGGGWMDFGWTPHDLAKGEPARLDMANYGGLILAKPDLSGTFGGLTFRYRAPDGFGDFLEVQLRRSGKENPIGRVHVRRGRGAARPDGLTEVWIPMAELNPQGRRFDQVVFFAARNVTRARVLLDGVGLTRAEAPASEPPRQARLGLDCRAEGHAISPDIYGVGGSDGAPWALGATARRWGGNPTSRYNWEINAWNAGSDWFFRNGGDSRSSYDDFLKENAAHGLKTALTVPMLGWVAKDGTSYSFPVSLFGPQRGTAPELPDAGNGVTRDGRPLAPGLATRTSIASTPESIGRWVKQIRERDRERGGARRVHMYILDNEPMLWHVTHRDVHPGPASYDELLDRTLAYASAVRRADPEATIAGPASWGWLEYHYSARDVAAGVLTRPDRRLHGDVPLVPWYLRKLREHERRTGERLLDVLDVHFYPMGEDVGTGRSGETDPATAALRIRSTRSLWDPSYVDESWIDERMRVLPLLREWVSENYPGLGISIGEWSFGAESHMSGGLATAEALGRFATNGVDHAFYWTIPAERSPAFWAFRAYRNFDGAGGRFLDWSLPVKVEGPLASGFASRDAERRRIVAVLLNFSPRSPLRARVDLGGCGTVERARALSYQGGDAGFGELEVTVHGEIANAALAPYSITVLDLRLAPPP